MSDDGGFFHLADTQFTAGNKKLDAQQFALFSGLRHLNAATQLSFEAISKHIERLHQKIDRIEKKVGSVR